MINADRRVSGTVISGVLPETEARVSEVADKMQVGKLADLQAGNYGIVLGAELATYLGVWLAIKSPLLRRKCRRPQRGLCLGCADLLWWVFQSGHV